MRALPTKFHTSEALTNSAMIGWWVTLNIRDGLSVQVKFGVLNKRTRLVFAGRFYRWSRYAMAAFTLFAFCGCNNTDDDGVTADAPQQRFQKPVDGELSESQLIQYIAIRQKIIHEVNAQKQAINMAATDSNPSKPHEPPLRHFDEIEQDVANSSNMSYEEFSWIKDTVIHARTQLLVSEYYRLNNRITALLDQALLRYQEINRESNAAGKEQGEQQIMDAYVEEMQQEIVRLRDKTTASELNTPALQHNMALVEKYQSQLDALQ